MNTEFQSYSCVKTFNQMSLHVHFLFAFLILALYLPAQPYEDLSADKKGAISVVDATNYYVKVSGTETNDGLSWSRPTTLDKALLICKDGDSIHIAEGKYIPTREVLSDEVVTDRDRTFEISKNVALIGGYPANASNGDFPDHLLYPTILDGYISYQSDLEERLRTGTNLIGEMLSSVTYYVAQGARVAEIAYTSIKQEKMKLFVYEIDLTVPTISVEVSTPDNQNAFKRQKMTEQAVFEDGEGHKVWGGVNGDFFNMETGEPQGIVYKNGVALKESFFTSSNTFFAITYQRRAVIGGLNDYNSIKSTLKEALGGRTWLVKNGVVQTFTNDTIDAPRTCIGVSIDRQKIYILSVDGRQETYSNGMNYEELSDCMYALGAYNAINIDGGGSTTFFRRKTDDFSAGRFEIRNKPSDGTERPVANGLLIISNE